MGLNVILPLVGGLAVIAVLAAVVLVKNRTAYLGPVKEELQKEKAWLRRGEYNAAMVKGRQNLELLLKLVAEKNGIQLDNSAKAQADAREEEERRGRNGRRKTPKVMTYHQFNRWLSENGYLDRVARWEMNQVRLIGNKAAHENYSDKDDAWNQFNYLEDILKTITERSQNPKKRQEQSKKHEHDGAQKRPQGQKKQGKKPQKESVKQVVNPPVQEETEQTTKKKKRRKKKSGQKPQNALEVSAVVVAETSQPEKMEREQTEMSQPELEPVKKKRRRRRKSSNKKAEPGATSVAAENIEAKSVKVEKKPVAAEVKNVPTSDDLQEEIKKKPRRRRRRKKPQDSQNTQTPQGQNETVKAQEPKMESVPQKETAVMNEGEKKPNPHKRRRRRRPRKPQGQNGQTNAVPMTKETGKNSSGE